MGIAPGAAIAFVACGGADSNPLAPVDAGDGGFGGSDASASPDMGADGSTTPDMAVSDDGGRVDMEADVGTEDVGTEADMGEETCELTGSDVEGPFHIDGAPQRTVLADQDEPGERLMIEGTVYGPDCKTPVANAMLDVWHADDNGDYHDDAEYRLRGQVMTDDQGRYAFETIIPGRYPLGGSTRPAHIHFMVSKPGFRPLTTQLYFEGDPFLNPNDPCGAGCNSGDPTLIIALETQSPQMMRGTFDINLDT